MMIIFMIIIIIIIKNFTFKSLYPYRQLASTVIIQ